MSDRIQLLESTPRGKTELLASMIKEDIDAGIYKPGQRIPSNDDLSIEFGVNRLTLRRALKKLEEEGYLHSISAKGTFVGSAKNSPDPNKRASMTVGIASKDFRQDNLGYHHMEMLNAVRDSLSDEGYNLQWCRSIKDEGDESWVNGVLKSDLAGVFVLGSNVGPWVQHLRSHLPLIHLDPMRPLKGVPSVCIDNILGGRLAAEYLLEQGHKSIAVITGGDQPCNEDRLAGFQIGASNQAKVKVEIGDFTRPSGFEITQQLLKDKWDGSAIFCFNDEMAAGCIQGLLDMGRKVPSDVSVLGFDDSAISTLVHPNLSSIGVNTRQFGEAAVKLMVQLINKPVELPPNISIHPELIERDSIVSK